MEFVSVENATVSLLVTLDNEVHLVAVEANKAAEVASYVKEAITSLARTERTDDELKAFLGIR